MVSPPNRKIAEIECLRGLAAACTVLNHMLFGFLPLRMNPLLIYLRLHTQFDFGVDIFFVISGFVIMRTLMARVPRWSGPTFWRSVYAFWRRRAWRLYPAAWLCIALGLALSWVYSQSGFDYFASFETTLADSVAAFFQYYNFYLIGCFPSRTCGTNQVYWSLSLEEQFYFLFPFVLWLSRRHLPKILLAALFLQLLWPRPLHSWLFYVRSDGFIVGILLAIAHAQSRLANWEPCFMQHGALRRPVLIALFLLAPCIGGYVALGSYAQTLFTVLASVLVYLASFDRGYLLRNKWLTGFLVWLGARSYSVYLLHLLAFGLTVQLLPQLVSTAMVPWVVAHQNSVLIGVALVFTLVLSEAAYRWLEKPLLAYGRRREAGAAAASV